MDSLSPLKAIAKATYKTTPHAPLDNDGKCPYCLNQFYETRREINEGLDEVECQNCHKLFFISYPDFLI